MKRCVLGGGAVGLLDEEAGFPPWEVRVNHRKVEVIRPRLWQSVHLERRCTSIIRRENSVVRSVTANKMSAAGRDRALF